MFNGRLLQVFNCYREPGGEETFVRQFQDIVGSEQMRTVYFESKEWTGQDAPSRLAQARLTFHNQTSINRVLEEHKRFRPDAWIFGNLFPVGSAGLYQLAAERRIPVLHFAHNFRPFSVNGTLWVNGRLCTAGLQRNFWPEVAGKSWRDSYLTTALFALVLRKLHRSGWLTSIDAWVTVSEFLRQKFIQGGFQPSQVFALHPFWLSKPAPDPVPERQEYLFVGRLIPEKGINVLLAAWEQLCRDRGPDAPRLIVAGRGPCTDLVRAAAARFPAIVYKGFVSEAEKNELIRGCRAMIIPSVWWEALGVVTYEAYSCGRPVIAARTGGLTETVQHGVTGLLHEASDAASLAAAVMDMDRDAARRARMGAAGREWLLEHADPQRFKRKLFEIAETVLQRRGVSSSASS